MKQFNRTKGNEGETLAVSYLIDHGYHILSRNFRTKYGEIDIVCQKDNVLVFVEVKTKFSDDFGSPEDMFTRHKLNKVHQMAEFYLLSNKLLDKLCRIDLVAINSSDSSAVPTVKHYENLY